MIYFDKLMQIELYAMRLAKKNALLFGRAHFR